MYGKITYVKLREYKRSWFMWLTYAIDLCGWKHGYRLLLGTFFFIEGAEITY